MASWMRCTSGESDVSHFSCMSWMFEFTFRKRGLVRRIFEKNSALEEVEEVEEASATTARSAVEAVGNVLSWRLVFVRRRDGESGGGGGDDWGGDQPSATTEGDCFPDVPTFWATARG